MDGLGGVFLGKFVSSGLKGLDLDFCWVFLLVMNHFEPKFQVKSK